MGLECQWRHARKWWAENLDILKNTWVGDKMPNWEPAADRGLWALSDPRLSNPAKIRKKYCWVNIAVCPRLQLISHTQQKHHPFENKVWEIYFYKEVYSFVHWSHYCWLFPLIFVIVYMQLYGCEYTTFDNFSMQLKVVQVQARL